MADCTSLQTLESVDYYQIDTASIEDANTCTNYVTLTLAEYSELQNITGLPKLTAEQGGLIAAAILFIWAIGFGFRTLKRAG